MPRFHTNLIVTAPIDKVWAFHTEVSHLVHVLPRDVRPHLLKVHERFEVGTDYVLRMIFGYWWTHWHARVVEVDPPHRFVDELVVGPLPFWRHVHRFEPHAGGGTLLTDEIEYQVPWGRLGGLYDTFFLRWQLRTVFDHRRKVLDRLIREG